MFWLLARQGVGELRATLYISLEEGFSI